MVRALFALSALLLVASPVAAQETRPRIAVVVKGDPSPELVRAAEGLAEALEARGDVMQPSDAAARAALRGATSETEDGLADVRAARRSLGWDETRDVDLLVRLGTFFDCDALVIVRSGTPPVAEVFDVGRRDFYDGVATLDDETFERPSRFVRARARAARERRLTDASAEAAAATTPVAAAAASATGTAAAGPGAQPGSLAAATEPSRRSDAPPARRFFRKNWPFFVAGALLAGAITWVVIAKTGNDTPAPVVHVRPGGSN
ncbi:MAG: hypothetical protein U0230_18310 [Polyangiales bacterium]